MIVTPGVFIGTRICDCCECFAAVGSVLPMTIRMSQRVSPAPEANHLRPLTTYESPSRLISVAMFVASDEATAGSVIQNAERISPFEQWLEPPVLVFLRRDSDRELPCCRCRARCN